MQATSFARRPVAWSLALVALASTAQPADDAPWQLRQFDEASGTSVYLRARGDDTPAFRCVTHLRVRLATLVAVLLDTDGMPEWVFRTRRVVRLEADATSTSGVSQVVTAMPWPLLDREAIVAWRITQETETLAVTIDGRSAPERLAPTPGLVRMPSFESQWRFSPLANGTVEVRFEGHGDPGGKLALPALRGFVDAAVWQGPLQTMKALRGVVTRPDYRDAMLPFIREPAP